MVVRKRLRLKGPAIAFVTTTVYNRKPILDTKQIVAILLKELLNITTLFKLSIISYVIMPSHIHLLIGFPMIENLSKIIQGFKSVTSKQVRRLSLIELADNNYKLWKPRFDDLIITSEKQLKIKMEYIHNNPVKAGLVDKADMWAYTSAGNWLSGRNGLIPIDKEYKWLLREE